MNVSHLLQENGKLRQQVNDLKREVIYHEQLSEEKERTIKLMQSQIQSHYSGPNQNNTQNKTTQTDRVRQRNVAFKVLPLSKHKCCISAAALILRWSVLSPS